MPREIQEVKDASGKTTAYKLEDNKYRFEPIDKTQALDLNSKSDILLVLDGRITETKASELFIEADISKAAIRGFSVLQLIDKDGNIPIDDKRKVNVSFVEKSTGIRFKISEVADPMLRDFDHTLKSEDMLKVIALLDQKVKVADQPVIPPPPPVIAAVPVTPVVDEPLVSKKIDKPILGGEKYADYSRELSEDGYTEFKKDNYRYFENLNDDTEPIYFIRLAPNQMINLAPSLEFDSTDEDDENIDRYSFKDDKDLFMILNRKDKAISIVNELPVKAAK